MSAYLRQVHIFLMFGWRNGERNGHTPAITIALAVLQFVQELPWDYLPHSPWSWTMSVGSQAMCFDCDSRYPRNTSLIPCIAIYSKMRSVRNCFFFSMFDSLFVTHTLDEGTQDKPDDFTWMNAIFQGENARTKVLIPQDSGILDLCFRLNTGPSSLFFPSTNYQASPTLKATSTTAPHLLSFISTQNAFQVSPFRPCHGFGQLVRCASSRLLADALW